MALRAPIMRSLPPSASRTRRRAVASCLFPATIDSRSSRVTIRSASSTTASHWGAATPEGGTKATSLSMAPRGGQTGPVLLGRRHTQSRCRFLEGAAGEGLLGQTDQRVAEELARHMAETGPPATGRGVVERSGQAVAEPLEEVLRRLRDLVGVRDARRLRPALGQRSLISGPIVRAHLGPVVRHADGDAPQHVAQSGLRLHRRVDDARQRPPELLGPHAGQPGERLVDPRDGDREQEPHQDEADGDIEDLRHPHAGPSPARSTRAAGEP